MNPVLAGWCVYMYCAIVCFFVWVREGRVLSWISEGYTDLVFAKQVDSTFPVFWLDHRK